MVESVALVGFKSRFKYPPILSIASGMPASRGSFASFTIWSIAQAVPREIGGILGPESTGTTESSTEYWIRSRDWIQRNGWEGCKQDSGQR